MGDPPVILNKMERLEGLMDAVHSDILDLLIGTLLVPVNSYSKIQRNAKDTITGTPYTQRPKKTVTQGHCTAAHHQHRDNGQYGHSF